MKILALIYIIGIIFYVIGSLIMPDVDEKHSDLFSTCSLVGLLLLLALFLIVHYFLKKSNISLGQAYLIGLGICFVIANIPFSFVFSAWLTEQEYVKKTPAADEKIYFRMDYNCNRITNNSVGGVYICTFINGEKTRKEEIITLDNCDISAEVEIHEDDSHPTKNSEEILFKQKESDWWKGYKGSVEISIWENRGRYAGNVDTYEITYRLNRVTPPGTTILSLIFATNPKFSHKGLAVFILSWILEISVIVYFWNFLHEEDKKITLKRLTQWIQICISDAVPRMKSSADSNATTRKTAEAIEEKSLEQPTLEAKQNTSIKMPVEDKATVPKREVHIPPINVGAKIKHNTFGAGTITHIRYGGGFTYMSVIFDSGEKTFIYPDAFHKGFLESDETNQ